MCVFTRDSYICKNNVAVLRDFVFLMFAVLRLMYVFSQCLYKLHVYELPTFFVHLVNYLNSFI